MSEFRRPVAGVPKEVHFPDQVFPHADLPRGLPGGISFLTEVLLEPQVEDFTFIPPLPVVFREPSSEGFRTEFHESPAVIAPEVFLPSSLPGFRKIGGKEFRTEYHEAPPPPPDIAFASGPPPPRRSLSSPPQSIFTTIGVTPPAATVRRGLYDDFGLYSRDV